jgi:hypothetical protein
MGEVTPLVTIFTKNKEQDYNLTKTLIKFLLIGQISKGLTHVIFKRAIIEIKAQLMAAGYSNTEVDEIITKAWDEAFAEVGGGKA